VPRRNLQASQLHKDVALLHGLPLVVERVTVQPDPAVVRRPTIYPDDAEDQAPVAPELEGLSGRALAALAGWHFTKVSKAESARQSLSDADIRLWCQ
jgi:hypothetical protein